MASQQSNSQSARSAPVKKPTLLQLTSDDKSSSQAIPVGCFCLAIGPQTNSITTDFRARVVGLSSDASPAASASTVASVTETGPAATPPPKYIQFFMSADSEGAGMVRWKAEWLREAGVFKLLPAISHAIPTTSSTTIALGIIILSRKEIKPQTPGKKNQLENRKKAITAALEIALKESKKYRGRDHVKHFFRLAILELEKTGDIHLPMKKVKGLTSDTWTPDPEPLLDEMVSLLEEMHAAGRGYKMVFAWNSW